MECRKGCGACCVVLSISSAIPGMPDGKPAGIRCIHLGQDSLCLIYENPDRPQVCRNLRPSKEMCGYNFNDAHEYLMLLEKNTSPL